MARGTNSKPIRRDGLRYAMFSDLSLNSTQLPRVLSQHPRWSLYPSATRLLTLNASSLSSHRHARRPHT